MLMHAYAAAGLLGIGGGMGTLPLQLGLAPHKISIDCRIFETTQPG